METGSHELAILSYGTVPLNYEKICREFSEHKIAVCEKTAGLRSGLFGFELSGLESVSSRRNISVLRHALRN